MSTKKKTKLDADQITLQAEAAYHWLQPGTRAAVQVLRDWVDQTQALPEELQPPTWPQIEEALAELEPVSARAQDLAAAKVDAKKVVAQARTAWATGTGTLDALLEARIRANTLGEVDARTVWAANADAAVTPIQQIGDKLITEWLQPQVQHYWEQIRATFPASLAAKLKFGILNPQEIAVNQEVLDAFPQVLEWLTALRNAQQFAARLRENGFVSVAQDVEGMDKDLVQTEARYNWEVDVSDMLTRFGKLVDEDDPAQWLAAALVHGKGPTLLTGTQVDERGEEAVREVTSYELAQSAQDAWGPGSGGTTIIQTGEKPLFYAD